MTLATLIIIGIVLLIAAGTYQSFRAHVRHHGYLPVLWRWFSGRQHHGVKTDNKRKYRAVYNPHDPGYDVKIRLHKAIQRTGWTLAPPVLAAAAFTGSHKAIALFVIISLGLIAEFAWRMYKMERRRGVDKKVLNPLHRTLATEVGVPLATRPGQWITFDAKENRAKVELPKNFHPSEPQKNRIGAIIRDTLGMEPNADVVWGLKGNDSFVEVKQAQPPPEKVYLKDINTSIEEAGQDKVVLGIGRGGEGVSASLAEDSPHFGLSIAAGGGKSQLARLAATQILHNGGIVLILDVKRISHAWARDLPNVRYARSIQEIHEALLWLHYEINRRTLVADTSMDVEGEVLANVGPRFLVIAEELNETMARLRRYWAEIRTRNQPKKSPAIEALEESLFMGRQIRINMLAVAQMMTALAAGSGAARENMGIRILGRYSRNAWRMLVPEFEMPIRSMKPGRVQVVTSEVKECQIAFSTGAEAREFALDGTVTPFPAPPEETVEIEAELVPIEAPASASTPEDPRLITLPESVILFPKKNLKWLQNARLRDPNFPKPAGRRMESTGRPNVYSVEEMRRWGSNVLSSR